MQRESQQGSASQTDTLPPDTCVIRDEHELRELVRFRQYERGIVPSPALDDIMFSQLWRQNIDGEVHVLVPTEEYRRFRRYLSETEDE